MGDEGGEGVPYSWTSLEPLTEGQEEPATGKFVKSAGRAKVTYPNADTFEGSFNDAKQKHGKGTYTWSTATGGNTWVPEEGYKEGQAPTVRYDGAYVDGVRQGIGKLSLPNGDKYHGQWEKDKFHGEGTYYYKNGDIYSGGWNKGVKTGNGTFYIAKDGSQLVGTWEKGSMISGKWIWQDGSSWHGPFKNSTPLGKGIFYFTNGLVQEGEYVQEGDTEDPEAELKTVWKAGTVRKANTSAAEVIRA